MIWGYPYFRKHPYRSYRLFIHCYMGGGWTHQIPLMEPTRFVDNPKWTQYWIASSSGYEGKPRKFEWFRKAQGEIMGKCCREFRIEA